MRYGINWCKKTGTSHEKKILIKFTCDSYVHDYTNNDAWCDHLTSKKVTFTLLWCKKKCNATYIYESQHNREISSPPKQVTTTVGSWNKLINQLLHQGKKRDNHDYDCAMMVSNNDVECFCVCSGAEIVLISVSSQFRSKEI